MASTPLRAPVQAETDRAREKKPAATIDWAEHVEAWNAYAQRYGRSQSAERIAERGGFGFYELCFLLGRPPTTWRPVELAVR